MKDTIEKMAHLARLKFPEAELERFTKKTEHILKYIDMLNEIDTSGMEATSHAASAVNAFREDKVEAFANPQKIIDIAPEHEHNLFVVPQVIE